MWPKPDIEATCQFMEMFSDFFHILNVQENEFIPDKEKGRTLEVRHFLSYGISCSIQGYRNCMDHWIGKF